MPLTYKAANIYLGHLVGAQTAHTWETYVGLSTTAPNRDGSGYTEPPASAGYKRVSFGGAGIDKSSIRIYNGAATNQSTIFFPEATDSWGEVTYYLIFSRDDEKGELLAYGPLDEPITPENGMVPIIRPGNLSMTMR